MVDMSTIAFENSITSFDQRQMYERWLTEWTQPLPVTASSFEPIHQFFNQLNYEHNVHSSSLQKGLQSAWRVWEKTVRHEDRQNRGHDLQVSPDPLINQTSGVQIALAIEQMSNLALGIIDGAYQESRSKILAHRAFVDHISSLWHREIQWIKSSRATAVQLQSTEGLQEVDRSQLKALIYHCDHFLHEYDHMRLSTVQDPL